MNSRLSTTSPALDVSDHQPTSLAHRSPVIFMSRSTMQADLIVTTTYVDVQPGKIDASSRVPDNFQKNQCITDSLRTLQ